MLLYLQLMVGTVNLAINLAIINETKQNMILKAIQITRYMPKL